SQLASKLVTVALSGDRGVELFAGYNRYLFGTRVLSRVKRLARGVRRLVAEVIGSVPQPTWDRLHRMTTALLPGVANQHLPGERMHKLGNLMRAASVGDMYRALLSAWQQPDSLLVDRGAIEDPNRRILDGGQPAHLL